MSRQDKLTLPKVGDGSPELPATDDRLQVDLRLSLDEVATAKEEELRHSARRLPSSHDLLRLACKMYEARRTRDKLLGNDLFGEPAWDMLLALYCLPKRGELLGVTSLSHAAEVPATTGLRWQKSLMADGLIERGPDEVDLRRQMVRLTPKGKALLENYLTRLFYCDTPAPPGR
ncbi:MarR family winged helix-turn-helix transcriptional regulator [Sphingomonas sp.]|uniref:MarR family winged helix-turn-helix transcriptional regulator n=1 Tax=Sphingomonas sp. TaxID=28214 RepID=UPI0025FBC09B|nr:MarR family winged helix-turn-helix transcriptional regulator [Sphingomonas sp.]